MDLITTVWEEIYRTFINLQNKIINELRLTNVEF
jgi:hypothetical protein